MLLAEFILPRFPSPEAAQAFRTENDASKFVMRRFFLYFGIAVYAAHAGLDIWVGSEATADLLLIRLLGTLGMLLCAVAFHHGTKAWISDSSLVALYLGVATTGVVGMCYVAGGMVAALYPFGLLIVLAFGGTILALPFAQAVILSLGSSALYWLSTYLSPPPADVLPIVGFFLTVGYISVVIGALIRERLERLQALAQWKLREINTRLEKSRAEAFRARDEALEARRTQSQFIANMSHELRTPLNAINGFSEVMMREALGPLPEIYAGYAKDIHNSGITLLRNVNDLLDVNRLRSGKLSWEEEWFQLSEMIRQAIGMCLPEARRADVELLNNGDSLEIELLADKARMSQVVTNLITNAVKFSHQGKSVQIGVYMRPGGGCEIAVTDTGIGISAEDLPRIGNAFEQAEDGRVAKKKGGLGLGLAIVRGILERVDGQLEIKSELGKGTTASVILPENRISRPATLPRAVSA